jgi:hypothetical protein
VLRVGLAERQVVFARTGVWGSVRASDCGLRDCLPCDGQPPWQSAVEALAAWLAQAAVRPRRIRVALSGRFVRWQLLPWSDAMTGPSEWQALARWRMRETYGPVADQWAIQYAVSRPGQAVCASAVDQGLIEALREACGAAGAVLQSVTPYFSSAYTHWQRRLDRGGAWFVVRESDYLSLGLWRAGQWLGVASSRVDSHWRVVLDRLMLQTALPVGIEHSALPLYLVAPAPGAGDAAPAQARSLLPAGNASALAWRMAVGI